MRFQVLSFLRSRTVPSSKILFGSSVYRTDQSVFGWKKAKVAMAVPKSPTDAQGTVPIDCHVPVAPPPPPPGAGPWGSAAVKLHTAQLKVSLDNIIPFQFQQTMEICLLENRPATGRIPVLLCPNWAWLHPRRLESGQL